MRFFWSTKVPTGFERIELGEKLLSENKTRKRLMSQTRKLASVTDKMWTNLYFPVLVKCAETMQKLPGSQYQHHSYPGGLLDHTLESVRAALVFRSDTENPFGIDQDNMVLAREVFTYAVFISACCHDVGKALVDHTMVIMDKKQNKAPLKFFGERMSKQGMYYASHFFAERDYALHERCALMVIQSYVPVSGLNWISENRDVFGWVIGSFTESENPISHIVKQADIMTVKRNLGMSSNSKQNVQGRAPFLIPMFIREMIDSGRLNINEPGAMGFVKGEFLYVVSSRFIELLKKKFEEEKARGLPQSSTRIFDLLTEYRYIETRANLAVMKVRMSSDNWKNTTDLPCIKLVLSEFYKHDEKLPPSWNGQINEKDRASSEKSTSAQIKKVETLEKPVTKTVTTDQSEAPHLDNQHSREPVVHETQKDNPTIVSETTDDADPVVSLDNAFVQWLKDGLLDGSLKINTRDAMIHVTKEGLALVTPAIFKLYEELVEEDYLEIQNAIAKAKINKSNGEKGYLFKYNVKGQRKNSTVYCWLLSDDITKSIFGNTGITKKPNQHFTLSKNKAAIKAA